MMSTFSNPPGETQAHTVLIVEPDSYWRKVHSMDVSRDGTFEVLCAVRNKRQAVAFLSRLPVDFIVTNSMLPDGNPADIIRFAQKRNPDCLVLAASDCEDANIVMQTITSGANGYVLFSDKTTNLCSCLRVLQAGGSPASPAVASTVLRSLQSRENQRQQMPEKHPLTARELDTLRLLAEGISFSQISHILVISKSTVSTHAANIYRKLDVHSRTEAVYRSSTPDLEIPTLPSPIDQLQKRLARLPLADMVASADVILRSLATTLGSGKLDTTLETVTGAFAGMQATFARLDSVLAEARLATQRLNTTLGSASAELPQALESFRLAMENVERTTRTAGAALHPASPLMEDILAYCSGRARLGIITNGPADRQWDKVKSLQAERWIPHENIFVSADVGAEKPDRKIFDYAKQAMNLDDG